MNDTATDFTIIPYECVECGHTTGLGGICGICSYCSCCGHSDGCDSLLVCDNQERSGEGTEQ